MEQDQQQMEVSSILVIIVGRGKGGALDGLGDVVHVLGLDDGVEVVLQDAREVVLQLAAPPVRQHLLPVRRVLRPAPGHRLFSAYRIVPLCSDACLQRKKLL